MGCKLFESNYLKHNGIDAHRVKDYYGAIPNSRYDIYLGETVTIRDKKGRLFFDTGMDKDLFFNAYHDTMREHNHEHRRVNNECVLYWTKPTL